MIIIFPSKLPHVWANHILYMFMLIIFVYRPILGHCDYYFSPLSIFFLRLKQLKPGSIPTLEGFFYMLKPHFPTRLVAMHTSVSLRPGRWPLPLFLGWCSPRHLGSQYIAYCRCIYIYIHTVYIYIYIVCVYIYTHVMYLLGLGMPA